VIGHRGGGAIRVVDLCEYFSILSGSDVLVHDCFDRYQLGGAYDYDTDATYGDLWNNEGRSLQMAYFWDHFTGGDESVRFLRETTGQRAKWVGDAADSGMLQAMLSTRTATNLRSQHRSAEFIVNDQPTAGQAGCGIMLRASQAEPAHQTGGSASQDFFRGTGYAAVGVWSAGGVDTPNWFIQRYLYDDNSGISLSTTLAQFEDTASLHWSGYGNVFVFDFEVYNQEGSTLNEQAVEMKLSIDIGGGLTLVSLVGVAAPGVSVVDGVVIDNFNFRIKQGAGEGMLFTSTHANAALSIYADTWTEEALTNEDLPDRDQASIVVGGEGSATGADLYDVIGVDYPLQIRTEHFAIRHEYDSGHRTTNPRFTNSSQQGISRTVYSCSVQGVKDTTLSTFLDYWHDHQGAVTAFPFTAPDASVSMVCHFVADSLQYTLIGLDTYTLSFQLEEVK